MSKFFDELTDENREFISKQKIFFTASGTARGRINLSPKGMDTFRVIGSKEVAYLDVTGSGNETAAHLKHDGRLTIMWCSFDAKPLILRLYCEGRSVQPDDGMWDEYLLQFDEHPGIRQIIVGRIDSGQTSCGFGVPLMEFKAPRPTLDEYSAKLGEAGCREYRRKKNQKSIDGLSTGLVTADEAKA